MSAQTTPPEIFWFIPCAGDGRHLGAATRPNGFAYLATLGYDGVLLPTGGLSEDTIVIGSALLTLTRRLRFLVAVRPGLISPILAARINASLDRISNGRANLNVVSGSGKFDFEGLPLSHEERYELTREWLAVFRASFGSDAVNFNGKHIHVENGKACCRACSVPIRRSTSPDRAMKRARLPPSTWTCTCRGASRRRKSGINSRTFAVRPRPAAAGYVLVCAPTSSYATRKRRHGARPIA